MSNNKKKKSSKQPRFHATGGLEVLYGVNPVFEAIRAKKRKIHTLYVTPLFAQKDRSLIRAAEVRNISVEERDKKEIARLSGREDNQGVCAMVSAYQCLNPEKFLKKIASAPEEQLPNILMIDNIQDVNNVAAVLRSAECLGLKHVVFTEREHSVISPVVCKRSAGAAEHLHILALNNPSTLLKEMKERGYYLYGLDAKGKKRVEETQFHTPFCIIIGSEGKGIRPKIASFCTDLLSITQRGEVSSMNLSTAAAITMHIAMLQQ